MEKYLITFSVSFKAPDGRFYNSAWGSLRGEFEFTDEGKKKVFLIGAGGDTLMIPQSYVVARIRCDKKPKTERYSVPIDSMRQEDIIPNIYIAE
jgi:hypothetical protein